jgi:hypothetical protein
MNYELNRDPVPLIVLQCASCKTILGDTSEFVGVATIKDTKLVVIPGKTTLSNSPCTPSGPLSRSRPAVQPGAVATEVTVDRIPQQSTTDAGEALAHFALCCVGCGTVCGRMYTAVPPHLAGLKDAFAVDVSRCTSYAVGSGDLRTDRDGTQPADDRHHAGAAPHQPDSNGQQGNVMTRIDALEAELLKMQHIILLHDVQLQPLPGYQSLPTEGQGAAPDEAHYMYENAPLALETNGV